MKERRKYDDKNKHTKARHQYPADTHGDADDDAYDGECGGDVGHRQFLRRTANGSQKQAGIH